MDLSGIRPSVTGTYLVAFLEKFLKILKKEENLEIKDGHIEMIENGACKFVICSAKQSYYLLGFNSPYYEYKLRIEIILSDKLKILIDDSGSKASAVKSQSKLHEVKSFIMQFAQQFVDENKYLPGAPNKVSYRTSRMYSAYVTNTADTW